MSTRLDLELARRGLARSRTEAAALIAQEQIRLNGQVATKAAQKVGETDRLERLDTAPRYVSRAGGKLAGALLAFPDVDPGGLRCLDAGASTGGFTDVLLRAGAREVLAVDVGHDQLVAELRADRRVRVHEGLNIRQIHPELVGGTVDLVVSDLSFISLRLVMDPLTRMCRPGAELVLMVKPQFEVGRAALPKGGVVREAAARRGAVVGVVASALEAGLDPQDLARSPLPGQDGNVEFFLHLRRPATPSMTPAPSAEPETSTQCAASWVQAQEVDWGDAA